MGIDPFSVDDRCAKYKTLDCDWGTAGRDTGPVKIPHSIVASDRHTYHTVSYCCNLLAQAYGAGQQPDYAQCLHAARRWIRGQDQWRSPNYWATFVHVGLN